MQYPKMYLVSLCLLTGAEWGKAVNPLSPNIHIQILQTDLHTFPHRIS